MHKIFFITLALTINTLAGPRTLSQTRKLIFSNPPIQLSIDSQAPTILKEAVTKAIKKWNEKLGKEYFTIGPTCTIPQWSSEQNCVYWIEKNWHYYYESQIAAANTRYYFLHDDGEIFHFHIFLNAQANRFSLIPGNGNASLVDVMVHELGHVLGLAHRTIHPNSVMVLGNTYSHTWDRNPSEDDVKSVLSGPVNDWDSSASIDTKDKELKSFSQV